MDKLFNFKAEKEFSVRAKSETRAEITIYSDIGQSFWGDSFSAQDFDRELKALPKSVNQIDLRLNSPGGDVFDGVSIYNRLKQHKAKVTVYVDGLAASIASVIMLAADKVVMGEGALVMIHKPWTMAVGDANSFMETIDRLNDVEEQILGIYQRRTGIDRTELRKMVSEETWMDASQALELGFADEMMEEEERVLVAASMFNQDFPWMNKKPNFKGHEEVVVKKIDEILSRM